MKIRFLDQNARKLLFESPDETALAIIPGTDGQVKSVIYVNSQDFITVFCKCTEIYRATDCPGYYVGKPPASTNEIMVWHKENK